MKPSGHVDIDEQETEETAAWALREIGRLRRLLVERDEQVARLIAGQRSASEVRQQAFLELAQDLAEMEPAQRDATIRRIITQHEEGR